MKNIKDYREKELKNYVIGNILLVALLSGIFNADIIKDLKIDISSIGALFPFATVSAVVYMYVFLLDSLIPGGKKQVVAYMNYGRLPGCTIFTDIKKSNSDYRLDVEKAKIKYKTIYDNMPEGKEAKRIYENANWYALYSKHCNSPKVYFANKDYLLCRDIVVMTEILIVVYILLICFNILEFQWSVLVLLCFELFLSSYGMRGKARRLAYNVIAEDLYGVGKCGKNEF